MAIDKLTRILYENGPVRKINEIIDALNQLIEDFRTKAWRLDKNINKIAKNTDLDTIMTQGTYTCPDSTVAQTLINTPHTSSNFRLIVTENITGYLTQEIQVYNIASSDTTNGKNHVTIWRRGHAGGATNTWYPWHQAAYLDSKVEAAYNADHVDHAATADHATNADYAERAGTADSATNAIHAETADYATAAGKITPVVIPANADLNAAEYRVEGEFYCPRNVDVETLLNCPTDGKAFSMSVYKSAGVTQVIREYGAYKEIWKRNYYSGTWQSWTLIIDGKDIETGTENGYIRVATNYNAESTDNKRDWKNIKVKGINTAAFEPKEAFLPNDADYQNLKGKVNELDGRVGDLEDEVVDLDRKILEGDYINMAPKIGKYGEDQVQVAASYVISNIEYDHVSAPVLTTDFFDREVMYWVGNGGGPNRNYLGLHKAYKSLHAGEKDNGEADWSWYNSNMVPKCFENKTNLQYKTIYGCDNNYLIVHVTENGTDKFYRIITNSDFNELNWTKYQDLTNALYGGSNKIIPGPSESITYRQLLHVKYFSSYDTLAAIWSVSIDMKKENWFYMTIWKCPSNANNAPTYLWGGYMKGFGSVTTLPSGYSFDKNATVTRSYNSSRATINSSSSGAPNADTCSVTIAETKSTITIVKPNFRFSMYHGSAYTLSDYRTVPIVFKLTTTDKNFFHASATGRTIAVANATNDFVPFGTSEYRTTVLSLNSDLSTSTSFPIVSPSNNTSYDSRKGCAYSVGFYYDKSILVRRLLYSSYKGVADSGFKYNGLKMAAYLEEFKLPDAAPWGKKFGNCCAMWNKIFISCTSNDGGHLLQIDPADWQFIIGETDSETAEYTRLLYIEPQPGKLKEVNLSKFRTILNEDLITESSDGSAIKIRKFTKEDLFNPTDFPTGYWGDDSPDALNGITSVKSGTEGLYYKAQYNKETKTIHWCKFEPEVGKDPIEIKKTNYTRTVTGLTTSLFNNGNASKTFIYPGCLIYNPFSKNFYIWGVCDIPWGSGSSNKIPHPVCIDATTGQASSLLYNNRTSKPSDYKWINSTVAADQYSSYITGDDYYTPLLPWGGVVLNTTQIIVFMWCSIPGSQYNTQSLLYTFSSDGKTLESVTRCDTSHSGITYLNADYAPSCAKMPLIYSGTTLGLCGFGETKNGTSYTSDCYKIDIRTQKPIISGSGSTYTDTQTITNFYSNTNNYTMYNQSASGLVANIPPVEVFLGGYYTRLKNGRQVTGLTPNTKNYIFMERSPWNDRTENGIKITKSTTKTIPIGADVFNKMCIAVVRTNADKAKDTISYHINTGENSWKFQSWIQNLDATMYDEYHKDL